MNRFIKICTCTILMFSIIMSYKPISATSDYMLTLNDGTKIIYYHQSSIPSKYTRFLENINQWNCNSGINKSFVGSGCSMYTMAMIVSNVNRKYITPDILMRDLGADISNNVYDMSRTGVYNASYTPSVRKNILASKIANRYGISWACVSPANRKEIDYYLSKGWLGYASWQHTGSGYSNNWYFGNMHFMAVRKMLNGEYYCITSAGGDINRVTQLMSTPISYKEMYNTMRNKTDGIYFFGKEIE